MQDTNTLFEKIKSEIETHTIKNVEVSFSIYQKRLSVIVNGEPHLLSDRIPDEVWSIGGEFKSPEDDWKIRVEMSKVTREFLLGIDPFIDTSKIIF